MKATERLLTIITAMLFLTVCGAIGCGGSGSSTVASAGPTPQPTPIPTATPTPTPSALTWSFLTTNAPPPPRFSPAGFVDIANNRMTIFAGQTINGINLNDVWVLTNSNATTHNALWTVLIPGGAAGSPPVRWGASSVYDSASNRMVIFGGCNSGCLPTLNDVWVLTNANGLGGTPAWIQLLPIGTPPTSRTKHTAVYDSANNRMIVFAGQNGSGNGCATFSDVWVLTNANGLGGTPAWIQLAPNGGPPAGHYGASAIYDAVNNRMIVFGGAGTITGACSDSDAVWVLTNANGLGGTPVWTSLVAEGSPGSPSGRSFHSAVYSSAANRMIVFGGNNEINDVFGDSWELSNANGLGGVPTWTPLLTSGGPPTRSGHISGFDPVARIMTVFGGGVGNSFLEDVWVLTNVN